MKQKLLESEYKRNSFFSAKKGVTDLGKGKEYYHHLHGALVRNKMIILVYCLMNNVGKEKTPRFCIKVA